LAKYADLFEENGVTFESFLEFKSEDELEEMGVDTFGKRF
jgi:hypothetical protein